MSRALKSLQWIAANCCAGHKARAPSIPEGKIRTLLAGSRQAPVFARLATPDIAFEDGQNGPGTAVGIAVGGTDSRKVIVHFRHPSLG